MSVGDPLVAGRDPAVLVELAPVVEKLLAEHADLASAWMPHELVPPGGGPGEPVDRELTAGVSSALLVNTLTEEALPFHTAGLVLAFGPGEPWWGWIRRWVAEENRHGVALRDYVIGCGLLAPAELDSARFAHALDASVPSAGGVIENLVYVALQELATQVAHRNTGRRLRDPAGRRLLGRIAGDEALHHRFYAGLVEAALDLHPDETVAAVSAVARRFTMPGRAIPGFEAHSRAIAAEGIYSASIFLAEVLEPTVIGRWHLDRRHDLSPAGMAARDRLLAFIDRLARLAPRLDAGPLTSEPRPDA